MFLVMVRQREIDGQRDELLCRLESISRRQRRLRRSHFDGANHDSQLQITSFVLRISGNTRYLQFRETIASEIVSEQTGAENASEPCSEFRS